MANTTEQEKFWKGEFGDSYIGRNKGDDLIASNTAFFSKILDSTQNVKSVLELGANIGLNLIAIKQLLPKSKLSAVEINEKAAEYLRECLPETDIHIASILDFQPDRKWDFVFTKGVLIHINPEKLPIVYELMYQSSSRYILVGEYYNPSPVGIPYRGHSDRLFKRDFAGEILEKYPDLTLVDYGFVYHRDHNFPQDDINWFLLEKK